MVVAAVVGLVTLVILFSGYYLHRHVEYAINIDEHTVHVKTFYVRSSYIVYTKPLLQSLRFQASEFIFIFSSFKFHEGAKPTFGWSCRQD